MYVVKIGYLLVINGLLNLDTVCCRCCRLRRRRRRLRGDGRRGAAGVHAALAAAEQGLRSVAAAEREPGAGGQPTVSKFKSPMITNR